MDTSLITTSVIVVVGIMLAYFIISYFFFGSFGTTLYAGVNDAKNSFTIDANTIGDVKQGQNYTLSWWMYIDDFNYKYGQPKTIMRRGVTGSENPLIQIAPDQPTLVVNVKEMLDDTDPLTGSLTRDKRCMIRNLDLQRWVHCAIVVSTKYMDIYYNGKLARSCVLVTPSAPQPNADLVITPDGGFSGRISKIQFVSRPATSQEVLNMYYSGPIKSSWFSMLFGLDEINIKYRNTSGNQSTFSINI
jgi:hypothetical protein